mgnify:CR=1 FL=1
MKRIFLLILFAAGTAAAGAAWLQARRPFRTSPPQGWNRGLDGRQTLFRS